MLLAYSGQDLTESSEERGLFCNSYNKKRLSWFSMIENIFISMFFSPQIKQKVHLIVATCTLQQCCGSSVAAMVSPVQIHLKTQKLTRLLMYLLISLTVRHSFIVFFFKSIIFFVNYYTHVVFKFFCIACSHGYIHVLQGLYQLPSKCLMDYKSFITMIYCFFSRNSNS